MATPILEVITKYCAQYVDDIRLKELAVEDPPLYARKMWGYLLPAIAEFTSPATMQEYLFGSEEDTKLLEPDYATTTYTTTEELTTPTTMPLGDDFIGFDLFSCRLRTVDDFENIILTPTSIVAYNANTGEITINASADNPVPQGTTFEMDFYTDGSFENTLTPEMMDILGSCFECVWLRRLFNDAIDLLPKVNDKSFQVQNQANKQRADTEKLRQAEARCAGKQKAYSQRLAYKKVVPKNKHLI